MESKGLPKVRGMCLPGESQTGMNLAPQLCTNTVRGHVSSQAEIESIVQESCSSQGTVSTEAVRIAFVGASETQRACAARRSWKEGLLAGTLAVSSARSSRHGRAVGNQMKTFHRSCAT